MKLIEFNWRPADRQLRQFGVICLIALPALAWLWGGGTTVVMTFALAGLLLAVAGMAVPTALKPVFLALTIVATPIGMVIGELAMLTIYFGVFVPFGLVFRLAKRDSLQLRLDRDKESYWEAKKQPANIASYYRQS
jgi:hypothetical protein